MPRVAGVSMISNVELMRRRPRPRTVARWDSMVPIRLLTSVTLMVLPVALACLALAISLTRDFFDRLAALRGHVRRRVHGLQAVQGRTHHVVRVGRADDLGEHVGDAH